MAYTKETQLQPFVYVVVLNWNGATDTLECLKSLYVSDYGNFRILVVDNHSTDDSVRRIRNAYPGQKVIVSDHNRGFAGGNNLAIRQAMEDGADYIWLLNNDAAVEADTLPAMLKKAQESDCIASVGCVIHDPKPSQNIQVWGGGRVNCWLGIATHFRSEVPFENLDYICGASILLSTRALKEVGILDEGYFLYWEDTELCFRLRAAGWMLAVAPRARVWHQNSASFKDQKTIKDTYVTASAKRFLNKYSPVPKFALACNITIRSIKRILYGQWSHLPAIWRGLVFEYYFKQNQDR